MEEKENDIQKLVDQLDPKTKIIFEEFGHMVGRILTIVEAATPDKQQRKSLKGIIQKTIYDTRNSIIKQVGGFKNEDGESK